ncbi:MAG: hypothetical protein IK115_04715 [Lachnospiraceae bacterium]|nr:hypothetical protein [Lachnospiraceae bacterium]
MKNTKLKRFATVVIITGFVLSNFFTTLTTLANDTPEKDEEDTSIQFENTDQEVDTDTQDAVDVDQIIGESEPGDLTKVNKPRNSDGVSTWDCIWFGYYWQEDTNGDGYCFAKDTTVSKDSDGNLVDQYGNRIYNSVTEGTYVADNREPIKWRVLEIDSDGNALLLSDRLIDIVEYNEKDVSTTWETSTLRSYLNSYGSGSNGCGTNFRTTGFLNKAFSRTERNAILTATVINKDNPIYGGGKGGKNTKDKIFCLSISEAMNPDYGFMANEFTHSNYTDSDDARKAVPTSFTKTKPGYYATHPGESNGWWLRTPGVDNRSAVRVGELGAIYAFSPSLDTYQTSVRPAFRMNLSSSVSLWTNAGTVCSDGNVNEMNKPENVGPEDPTPDPDPDPSDDIALEQDETDIHLIPGEIKRLGVSNENRYIYGVRWTIDSSSKKGCITLKNGIVKAKKAGTATVTATYGASSVSFNITVDDTVPESKWIVDGKKTYKLKVTKNIDTSVGAGKNKSVTVTIPAILKGKEISYEILSEGVCTVGEPSYNTKHTKASIEIKPLNAGATWIIWNMTDDNGQIAQAVTKVVVKKPLTEIDVLEDNISLSIGEAKRIVVTGTADNTDTKELSFSVKGKGVKVSKSGYVMATKPDATAIVTVKSGNLKKTVNISVNSHEGDYMTLNKTSVIVKVGAKEKTVVLKLASPKKKADQPTDVEWSVVGEPAGITVDGGKVSVSSEAQVGSYLIKAESAEMNNAYCEIIVK